METINGTITGTENTENRTDPYSTLVEFYKAFNNGNLELMQQNWLHSSEASMSNPLGNLFRGWEQISTAYDRIFNGSAEVYVEYYDVTIHHSGDMFCAVGRERGYFRTNTKEIDLAIRTSRIYCFNNNRWRQLHHHGSICDSILLAEYQSAVTT